MLPGFEIFKYCSKNPDIPFLDKTMTLFISSNSTLSQNQKGYVLSEVFDNKKLQEYYATDSIHNQTSVDIYSINDKNNLAIVNSINYNNLNQKIVIDTLFHQSHMAILLISEFDLGNQSKCERMDQSILAFVDPLQNT
jgi:hypothetical protein